jgi:hypothetical protein
MRAIPAIGTLKMQMNMRSSVTGVSPGPEIRDTERRKAGREIFGECCKHNSK